MSSANDRDLADRFRRLIQRHGPMPTSRYMGESNALYYTSRDPLGAAGDFTTAPEISQMFGEMIGLCCADLWLRMDKPDCAYAELGPGRGTLAKDALRAMAQHGLTPPVHLVEGSEALRAIQADALGGAQFHDSLDTLPQDRPLLIIANEFLDALPIRQLVRTENGWRERMIALNGEDFVFAAGPNPMDEAVPMAWREHPVGTVIETCPAAAALIGEIALRLSEQGGAALFFDYGHIEPRIGETMQAVRAHRKVGIFDKPGDMDITAHVDFAILAKIARQSDLTVSLTTQGEWLAAMGIGLRARALVQSQPSHGPEIAAAYDRLTSRKQMGELFKVMAITAPGWPQLAGFV